MFEDYFYFSSSMDMLKKHFTLYAQEILERFDPESVLEIGCNDGVLLKPLADRGIKRLFGIDPARNVTQTIQDPRITVINDYFRSGLVEPVDCIVANNVMAHIDDIAQAFKDVAKGLKPDGVFIFEVNRLDSLIADNQYDWVYHEHLYYYSLIALEPLLKRCGLRIFDLKRIGTHAGSIRYYACKDRRPETLIVQEQRRRESWHRLDDIERFHEFAERAVEHRERMRDLVLSAKGSVAGYGACGRANTMLQWCGFDHTNIDFIVDDATAKQGYFTPGSHIPIRSREALKEQPDMLIVFAWSFLADISKKCADYRGKMVIPLPDLYISEQRAAA